MTNDADSDGLDYRVRRVWVTDDTLLVEVTDGREIIAPLKSFPALEAASPQERRRWRLLALDTTIEWPELGLRVSLNQLPPPEVTDRSWDDN